MVTELIIKEMHCEGCVRSVKRALAEVAGVENVEIDLATRSVKLSGDASEGSLVEALANAGYDAEIGKRA